MKKIAIVAVVIALISMLAAGFTMAYFTDTEEAKNVMVMGNVDIEQVEQQFGRNEDGSIKPDVNAMKPFEQSRMILPVTKDPGTLQMNWNGGYPYYDLKNAIDKVVTVENKGNTGAYVRTVFAFEVVDGYALNAADGDGWTFIGNNTDWTWDWSSDPADRITVDGVTYQLVTATYKTELAKNSVTTPSLTQYIMMPGATQETVAGLAADGDLEIWVVSQAVQADGFDDATTALNAAFGEISAANHPFATSTNP